MPISTIDDPTVLALPFRVNPRVTVFESDPSSINDWRDLAGELEVGLHPLSLGLLLHSVLEALVDCGFGFPQFNSEPRPPPRLPHMPAGIQLFNRNARTLFSGRSSAERQRLMTLSLLFDAVDVERSQEIDSAIHFDIDDTALAAPVLARQFGEVVILKPHLTRASGLEPRHAIRRAREVLGLQPLWGTNDPS